MVFTTLQSAPGLHNIGKMHTKSQKIKLKYNYFDTELLQPKLVSGLKQS